MTSVRTLEHALTGHAKHRSSLVQMRKYAPCMLDADTSVEQVRADLDAAIAKEDQRIDALLAELHEARQATTV